MLLPDQMEILVCTQAVDMRKGADGLAGLVRDVLKEEPISRKLFVFQGKRKDRVKLFYWHINGFAVWSKRIEQGKFKFPSGDGNIRLNQRALRMILEGVDLKSLERRVA
jgi:transposase